MRLFVNCVNNKMHNYKKTFDNFTNTRHTGLMTDLIDQAKQRVRDHVAAGSWGVKSRLAKRAEIAPSVLTEMETDDWAPNSRVLQRLLKAIEDIEADDESPDGAERLAVA